MALMNNNITTAQVPKGAAIWRVFDCNCDACWWFGAFWPTLPVDDQDVTVNGVPLPTAEAPEGQATIGEVTAGD